MEIMNVLDTLFKHEKDALLESLRRDLRSEYVKADNVSPYAEYHQLNIRLIHRFLELLNPRGPHRDAHRERRMSNSHAFMVLVED
jgi:hypothetical protein